MNLRLVNFRLNVVSLSLTKVGDGLTDAKLALVWMLDAIGAPTWAIGLLVPVRESLSMLPQLLISARIRQHSLRKPFYIRGCVVQGVAMVGFGMVGLTLSGVLAGVITVGLIAVFALGRSLCSISQKDVLARTVDMGRRGAVSGIAGSIAAAATLLLAIAYSVDWTPLTLPVVASIVILGGLMWFLAALSFGFIREKPDMINGTIDEATKSTGDGLADRSSRWVLVVSAALATLANAVAAVAALVFQDQLESTAFLPVMLFALMIAHQGVRLGRSVHVIDMTDLDNRATYVALSNSVVGLILLAGGVFGIIAHWFGIGIVLALFALMAAMAIAAASGLDEYQHLRPASRS